MNNRKIDQLIARRSRLTNRRDGLYDHSDIDAIDRQLAALSPAGERNDVDLLLGRTCATLPPQPAYDAHSRAATVAARHADAANPNPQYVSLPKLMGEATVYNDWETFTRAVDSIDGYGMMGDRD